MGASVEDFLARLSAEGRVLLLGGIAVIAHGMARATKDVDVWFEPLSNIAAWTERLGAVLSLFPSASGYDLLRRVALGPHEAIEPVVARDGVVRIVGLDRPLDVFHTPHNVAPDEFDGVWTRATARFGGVRVPDEIDLLLTKEGTPRDQDAADIAYLESLVRKRLTPRLQECAYEEAAAIFRRYADHETCRASLLNPDERVRALGRSVLQDLADGGDPFAAELLRQGNNRPSQS